MQKSDENNIDLDSVYREYASLVYRFLYAHTHDAHWSEELMQETFLRVVTSIERYDGSCKLSVWICQIAKHVWYQELHKKKRTETVERTEGMEACTVSDGEADVLRRRTAGNYTERFIVWRSRSGSGSVPYDWGAFLSGDWRDHGKKRELVQDNLLSGKTKNKKGVECI